MFRQVATVAAVSALTGGAFGIAPPAHAANGTIKACVKKSNGRVKIVEPNKKCKKGWKKVTWNSSGETGPAGPAWVVKDANGTTLGSFSGYYTSGLIPQIMVTSGDGGLFRYGTDGVLANENGLLRFRDGACTQGAVFDPTAANLTRYLRAAGGPGRAVFQVTDAPSATAYKVDASTTSTTTVAANTLFVKNGTTGACTAFANPAGFIVPLGDAPAPVVAKGPLKVIAP